MKHRGAQEDVNVAPACMHYPAAMRPLQMSANVQMDGQERIELPEQQPQHAVVALGICENHSLTHSTKAQLAYCCL